MNYLLKNNRLGYFFSVFMLIFCISCTKVINESDLFYPRKLKPISDALQRKNVAIKTGSGEILRGWLLHAPHNHRYMIYFYGNGETLIHSQSRLYWMAATLKCNILAFDYRGYGFSDGAPSFRAILQDALTQYDYLCDHLMPPDTPVLVFGYSIGTVFATRLASERKIDGLILMAPMTSALETIKGFEKQLPWYVRWFIDLEPSETLMQKSFQPISMIDHVTCPLLFIHGSRDQVIPIEMGRTLFRKAPSPSKYFCEVNGASHNDLDLSTPPISNSLKTFFKTLGNK